MHVRSYNTTCKVLAGECKYIALCNVVLCPTPWYYIEVVALNDSMTSMDGAGKLHTQAVLWLQD